MPHRTAHNLIKFFYIFVLIDLIRDHTSSSKRRLLSTLYFLPFHDRIFVNGFGLISKPDYFSKTVILLKQSASSVGIHTFTLNFELTKVIN